MSKKLDALNHQISKQANTASLSNLFRGSYTNQLWQIMVSVVLQKVYPDKNYIG